MTQDTPYTRQIEVPQNNKPTAHITDGNAFAILGAARQAMLSAGYDRKLVTQYIEEASRGDYQHLLETTLEYVDVNFD